METEFKTITPAAAAALLERNTGNRALNSRKVAQYASDMAAGRWMCNGEALKIAASGRLLDGQHRLQACVESGVPFATLVVSGLGDTTQLTMDQGVKRTASNQFQLLGIKYATDKAAICRNLWHWREGAALGMSSSRTPSSAELLELLDYWPVADEAVRVSELLYRGTRFGVSRSTLGTFLAVALSVDEPVALIFAEQLRTGEMLRAGDPALTLRQQFISWIGSGRTLSRGQQIAWLWLGFCDLRAGKTRKVYKRSWLVLDVPELEGLRNRGA